MSAESPDGTRLISLSEAVEQVLAQLDGPISLDEFLERALKIRPSKAKNPKASMRSHLRTFQVGETLVFVERKVLLPLRTAMRGVRFRISLDRRQVKRGILCVNPTFDFFLRSDLSPQAAQLLDESGQSLPVRVVTVREQVDTMLGPYTDERAAFELADWFRARDIRRNDCILVTVEDWEAGRFCLRHEPAKRRRQDEIERKNRELADVLFDLLEQSRTKDIYAHVAIPTAYARLSDPRGYPGDHWIEVVEQDPRVRYNGWAIQYSDQRSPLEVIMFGREMPSEEPFTPDQAHQVHCFKAALWHRPGLWRRIEIQGDHTLADLDATLRAAFDHDVFDHLSGFWKRVRRGQGKRFREIALGTVDPFGEGEAAALHIAGLDLRPGDELKYIYGFGDRIQHRVTLEEIAEPDGEVTYPRIAGRNRPRYQYCQSCKAQGRQTRATWVCNSCSRAQQCEVLLCDECVLAEHEDHFAEEILC